ncbi:MAG: hypothetical protein ACRCZF_06465, partial [Gemmataceae bacterium]
RIYYTTTPPPVAKGRWIMDATIGGNTHNAASPKTVGTALSLRHANFYRVVSVTQDVDTTIDAPNTKPYVDIELQTPIKNRSDGLQTVYQGRLVVMPGLAEVFERPMLREGN